MTTETAETTSQALRGLDIATANGLTLVDDGESAWLASSSELSAWLASHASEVWEDEIAAYAAMCCGVAALAATSGESDCDMDAVSRALAAGLITERRAAAMGLAVTAAAVRTALAGIADARMEGPDRLRIHDIAPDSDGDDTGPGSPWWDECDRVLDEVRGALPAGWAAEWSDDDIIVERAP